MALILAIESSCDETSAAVMHEGELLSNVISTQLDHADYGGVIPELASRLHMQQVVRVVDKALRQAEVEKSKLEAIAFTRGPGLLGALIVGTCFAKAMALGLGIPLVEVNHMHAHVLANFIDAPRPRFPLLCLTVSGGHTQLVLARSPLELEVVGQTIDDAAGEAFDKAAKLMGLPYPGGPQIDRLAKEGNPEAFSFPEPRVEPLAFSFSGLKTSLMYRMKDGLKADPGFIQTHQADLAASYQATIVRILIEKLTLAAETFGITELALAGGVSANSELRAAFEARCQEKGWQAHLPPFAYCTDNAAMIAMAGHFLLQAGQTSPLDVAPFARSKN